MTIKTTVMKNRFFLFCSLFVIILTNFGCDPGVEYTQKITNNSSYDLNIYAYNMFREPDIFPNPNNTIIDSFFVNSGGEVNLQYWDALGELGEVPYCHVIADSVRVVVSDPSKTLIKDMTVPAQWVSQEDKRGVAGSGTKVCTFTVEDSDFE